MAAVGRVVHLAPAVGAQRRVGRHERAAPRARLGGRAPRKSVSPDGRDLGDVSISSRRASGGSERGSAVDERPHRRRRRPRPRSTTPLGRVADAAAEPSDVARRCTAGRKPTPCTTPRQTMRQRTPPAAALTPSPLRLAARRPRAARTTPPIPSPVRAEVTSDRARGVERRAAAPRTAARSNVDVRQQVHLGDHRDLGAREDRRVLERLVVPLGHRQQRDLEVLAEVVGGRADQVADVLDEEDVERREARPRRAPCRTWRASRWQAPPVRICTRRDAERAQPVGVALGGDVALDPGQAQPARERLHGRLQQRRLARAGRGDQVEHQRAARPRSAPRSLAAASSLAASTRARTSTTSAMGTAPLRRAVSSGRNVTCSTSSSSPPLTSSGCPQSRAEAQPGPGERGLSALQRGAELARRAPLHLERRPASGPPSVSACHAKVSRSGSIARQLADRHLHASPDDRPRARRPRRGWCGRSPARSKARATSPPGQRPSALRPTTPTNTRPTANEYRMIQRRRRNRGRPAQVAGASM